MKEKLQLENEIREAINRFELATGEGVYRIEMFRDLEQEHPPVMKVEVILY